MYAADQATSRGGLRKIDYKAWYRHFRFEIAVRRPDFWSSPEIVEELSRTLNDLSDDTFEFAFCRLFNPPPVEDYFDFDAASDTSVDGVMLFSGGLDSFGGAVEEVFQHGRKVALVSHRPVGKIDARQRALANDISSRVADRSKAPIHVSVLVNKAKALGIEHTQRTRSFLYATLAAVVARLFGLDGIRFYENGVISLNLPISPQVVSTRATRTTHPMVLAGFRRLFSKVFERPFRVDNPFFWKTKTDILRELKAAGFSRLCAFTSSCTHTREQTSCYTHCGRCSQCVDRRLVALAAGYGDEEDPPEMYRVDVLRDASKGIDRLLVESYIETINRIEGITNATQFCIAYPEISRALNHIDGSADGVAQAIYSLYRRHAEQVCGALDSAGRAAFSEMRRGELPPTCMLSLAAAGGRGPKMSISGEEQSLDGSNTDSGESKSDESDVGNDGHRLREKSPSDNGKWFSDDPTDTKFKHGPLEGELKSLAKWMDMDHRTIKRLNGQTSWWVKKVHGKKFAAWFSTQEKYAVANQKRLATDMQKGAK